MRTFCIMILTGTLLAGLVTGCEKGEGEKAGEKVDKAAEKTKDAIKEGADKTKDAIKEGADKAKDAVK